MIFRICKKLFAKLHLSYVLKRQHVEVGIGTIIKGTPLFFGNGRIVIGNCCRINSDIRYNPIGGDQNCIFDSRNNGLIQIGNNVGISNSTSIAETKILIDDNVRIGGSCKIYDTDFHSLYLSERLQKPDPGVISKPIHIKRGTFIGAHSIILKGVTIGENSVVGAGSVVTKDIPDNEIWGGNPAKHIRSIAQ